MDIGIGADPEGYAPAAHTSAAPARALKRGFDVLAAMLLLVFLLPLLLAVAAVILADSKGPVLFVQRRTGFKGKPFQIVKFRSMTVMEDGEGVTHAGKDDERVTRVGRFLRRSSIDELPQLINVLAGDMSLVGPRPHAIAHDQFYGALIPHYAHRFRARPGITGLAQVNGLRGEIRSLDGMVDRVTLDNAYIDGWSLGMDAQILTKTAAVILFQSTAY